MPVSRRTLLPALLGAIASIPRLASAADDVVTRASPYSPLPKPESEPARRSLCIGESLIDLSVEGREFTVSPNDFADWVTDCADIVTRYYGEFPIPSVDVRIRGARGNRVLTGQAMPTTNGAVVNVLVGLSASEQTLARDWVMIHELVHLAFPSVHASNDVRYCHPDGGGNRKQQSHDCLAAWLPAHATHLP